MSTISTLILLGVPLLAALSALWVLQRRWGLDSIGQSASECMSRLLPTPIRTRSSLRRRFVRALTSQRVLMPSGQVVAATSLHLRIAPEDVGRLAPDQDLDALATDAARLYARHAQREAWLMPASPRVSIEVDPVLRSGWIPLAQVNRGRDVDADGTGVADPLPVSEPVRRPEPARLPDGGTRPVAVLRPAVDQTQVVSVPRDATVLTAVRVPVLVLVTGDGERSFEARAPHAVIGRGEQCAVRLTEPAVSRRHARLEHRDGRWLLSDLGSSNGTFVGGQALAPGEERGLADGDEVRLSADGPALRITMRS